MFAAFLVLFVLVCGYLIFEFGRIQAGYSLLDAAKEQQALQTTIAGLEDEIATQKDQLAVLETHRDIEREAYKEIEATLTELQTKIQEQGDAIAFYRGIVSPADGKSGLRVQDFKLLRSGAEREFKIRLVLVQTRKHDRKVSGNVELRIAGELDGAEKSYSFADLLPGGEDKTWKFSFRYFQDFDRIIVLPEGFTPGRVSVAVKSRTRSIESIEETYSWSVSQG